MLHRCHLPKVHRLCSQTAVDRLFQRSGAEGGGSALAYPLRAVWAPRIPSPGATEPPVRFLISIPKKRLHHAVDRVLMRRRTREAYRLLRPDMLPPDIATPTASGATLCVDVAFVYVADHPEPYARVSAAMKRLLRKISAASCNP